MPENAEPRFSGAPASPAPEVFERVRRDNPAWYQIIERAYALGTDNEITLANLPTISSHLTNSLPAAGPCRSLDDFERELVADTLRAHKNDKSKAAEALGMSERTLYRRLKKHRLG